MESELFAFLIILPRATESFMPRDRKRAAPELASDSKVIPGPNPSETNQLISSPSYRPGDPARVLA
eukprot:4538749-Heterocapsa_arctica.AAC.1